MTTNGNVTIYSGGGRNVYRAHILNGTRTRSESGGEVYTPEEIIIRIPTTAEVAVKCGDYLEIGIGSAQPKRETRKKVIFAADRRRGTQPHYKVVAV